VETLLATAGHYGKQQMAELAGILQVCSFFGQEITILVNEPLKSGTYEVEWDPEKSGQAGLSSGVYFYKLIASDFVQSRKMILLK
jgi:hypothetical protein